MGGGDNTPSTGLRERGNDTSKSTGRSGRQKAATRRNMRREERVTVQGPVKEQQRDGMSHRGNNNQTECHTGGSPPLQCIPGQARFPNFAPRALFAPLPETCCV